LIGLAKACLAERRDARPRDASAVASAVAAYRAGVEERLRRAELERAAAEAREEEAKRTAAAEARAREAHARALAERRSRWLALGLVAVLLVGIAATIYFALKAAQRAEEAVAARGAAEEERGKAEEARRLAETQKERAEAAEKEARQQHDRAEGLVYAGQLALAQGEWEANNAAGAWQHLNATRRDFRGWEYWHLHTLCNSNQTTFRAHTGPVFSVCFSPDGTRLASASQDQTVKVWDAHKGQEVLTLQGHTLPVLSVCFSPDGTRLASASQDQTVKVWDASAAPD
jgi:hypothetical protein